MFCLISVYNYLLTHSGKLYPSVLQLPHTGLVNQLSYAICIPHNTIVNSFNTDISIFGLVIINLSILINWIREIYFKQFDTKECNQIRNNIYYLVIIFLLNY